VGLETMAAGGIAFTGSTGEDYAIHDRNAMVMETADPTEIEAHLAHLDRHPFKKLRMRHAGRETAKRYVWDRVIWNLIRKLEYQAALQGALLVPRTARLAHDESADWPALGWMGQPLQAVDS